jgi:hypothetical protein
VPLADGTLVATPDVPPDDLVPSFLAASDVLGTGRFGAVAAEVGPGKTVAVVGDGAVGLLGVLSFGPIDDTRRSQSRQLVAHVHDDFTMPRPKSRTTTTSPPKGRIVASRDTTASEPHLG